MDKIYNSNEQTIPYILDFNANQFADKLAIIADDESLTYQELQKRSNALANALHMRGIQKGERIAYLGKESAKYYVILFAVAKLGCTLVPINWRLKENEVSFILENSLSSVLFVDDAIKNCSLQIQAKLKFVISLEDTSSQNFYQDWLNNRLNERPEIEVKPFDTFAMLYTSGTTGLPKGVMLTHQGFFQVRNSLISNKLDWIDWQTEDVSLIGIPGFHIGGLWWAIQGFSSGITQVCCKVFHASIAVDLIKKYRITIACMVPAMIQMLLRESENTDADFATLRKVIYGGAPIAEASLEKAIAILGCQFAQIYGLTETGNTAICLPPSAHSKGSKLLKAAGTPYPCVEVNIRDEDNNNLPINTVGEVFLKTPAHMQAYWQLPEASASTLQDGWIRTGDAGYLNEQNYLFICDRIKDVIIVAGEKIFPVEVEKALQCHPEVIDVAVVGLPHPEWGESINAFVVSKSELQPVKLITFLKEKIADYKIPSFFHRISEIPRNPSGKILRRELRNQDLRIRHEKSTI